MKSGILAVFENICVPAGENRAKVGKPSFVLEPKIVYYLKISHFQIFSILHSPMSYFWSFKGEMTRKLWKALLFWCFPKCLQLKGRHGSPSLL